MAILPGIGGTLFPGRFLDRGIDPATGLTPLPAARLRAWWARVEGACGPATGLRGLFDLAAMPLANVLGFHARDATFGRAHATAVLQPAPHATPVSLVIRPWARRPSHEWRDVVAAARDAGADWCFLLAPPHFSLVSTRGQATRQSVDFTFPAVLDPRSIDRFFQLASARAFAAARGASGDLAVIDRLVAAGRAWQDRVRADLQHGVVQAVTALGRVVGTPASRGDDVPVSDEALTLVYRVLFLLFAESRALVPADHPVYGRSYSVVSACRDAVARPDGRGLWDGLAAVTRLSRTGCDSADLIVRPFNGRLFARAAAPSLELRGPSGRPSRVTTARDSAMRDALVALGSRPGAAGREVIDYADLGVEQLGAVYERLLDVDPARQRRKETGTFYTPRPLAEFLIRRTLAPLVAATDADGILDLRVVDPSMGSGAFLVAACRFLADVYERALIDEGRLMPADVDEARRADFRRMVAERCLAGVDANPVAVQLARLSLWLAALARGKPLSFLDHRLRVGDSLIGASPDDLARMPARARRRAAETLPLFDLTPIEAAMGRVCRPLVDLVERRDDTVADVRQKESIWRRLSSDRSPLQAWRTAASLWCARWFWPEGAPPSPSELRAAIDGLLGRSTELRESIRASWSERAGALAARHHFFHWPLEFPDVFYGTDGHPRERPGFDAVIGNPPWEMLRGSGRNLTPMVRFVRESSLFPNCDRGHLNLYQPFLDRALSLVREGGRVGLVLPWGLAADDGASKLRERLLADGGLDTIVGFDNGAALFPIHRGLRFVAVTGTRGVASTNIHARFGVKTAAEIETLPGRESGLGDAAYPVRLTPSLIRATGGRSARIADIRDPRLFEVLVRLARTWPALSGPSGWRAEFGRELNATDDRSLFGTAGLPIVEGKHLQSFRVGLDDSLSRISRPAAARRFPDRAYDSPRVGYRDVSATTNRRTLIAAIVPAGVVTTHTIFCLRRPPDLARQYVLCAYLNSFVLDALARMLMGGHLTTSLLESLPVPPWCGDAADARLAALARAAAERAAACGQASTDTVALQAAVAQRYRLTRDELAAILESFPLVGGAEKAAVLRAFGDSSSLAATPPA